MITPCMAESKLTEQTISELVAGAESALASGDAQKAAEMYEQAAAIGESAPAEIGLVRAYLQTGEFRKAVSFANLVAAEHADVTETAALLAYIEDREGHTAPALAKLKDELNKHPNDVALFAANMEILLDRQATPQAIEQLDAWITQNPPQGDIYRLRARAALAAGKYDEVRNWRLKAAQAYEAAGSIPAAQTLRHWLAKQAPDQQPVESTAMPSKTSASDQTDLGKNEKSETSDWPAPYQEAFPLSEQVTVKSGNGFVVDQGRQVVTYASLVANTDDTVLIRNGLGKIRAAKVAKILPEQGLALLRLKTPYAQEWSLPKQLLKVPDKVRFCFVLGFPIPDELETSYPIISPGVVVRPDAGIGNLMQITASIGPNISGGAVFDSSGTLIGMTLGNQESLKDLTNLSASLGTGNFAVRVNALQTLLPNSKPEKKKSAKPKSLPKKGTPSVEELYESLLPMVVTIVAPN